MYGTSLSLLSFFFSVVVQRGSWKEKEEAKSFVTTSWERGDDLGESGRRMMIVDRWEWFDCGYIGREKI